MPLATSLARQALAELDAEEPNRAPALLTAGVSAGAEPRELSWDDPHVQAQVHNDLPANAPTHRPHLIAACQLLDQAGYRAPGVRCSCGYGLGFLALAPLASGVAVVWSRRRLAPKQRKGGHRDFARLPGTRHGWDLMALADVLVKRDTVGPEAAIPRPRPGVESLMDRQTFHCPKCGRVHTVLNLTLVREVLQAIATGGGEVVLGQARGTHAGVPRYAERLADRGAARAWGTRKVRVPQGS